jgi:hypothetical protein
VEGLIVTSVHNEFIVNINFEHAVLWQNLDFVLILVIPIIKKKNYQ